MNKQENIIFKFTMKGIPRDLYGHFMIHALCRRGSCSFVYLGHRTTVYHQDLIVSEYRHFSDIRQSDDCIMEVILLNPQYVHSFHGLDYTVKGQMELYLNPVIHLTSEQMMVMRAHYQFINYHLIHTEHCYYDNVMMHLVQLMLLDIFNIHAQRRGLRTASSRYCMLVNDFVAMLDRGEYRAHRDADYYAGCLFVSSKHLSFVSRSVTGFSATYWINRYLQIDIREQLYKHSLSIKELSDLYNFSSPSYFCRYIEKNLGISPKELLK